MENHKEGFKTCILCNTEKELTEFYKHKRMSQGRDSKCKECVKERSRKRHHTLKENDEWLEQERSRHREKYLRLGYKDKQLEWDKDKPWKKTQTYKNLSRNLGLEKGFEAHHWNYNDDYLKDVFIMESSPHKILHTHLTMDIEKRIFFITETGKYLETKQEHEEFIKALNLEYKPT